MCKSTLPSMKAAPPIDSDMVDTMVEAYSDMLSSDLSNDHRVRMVDGFRDGARMMLSTVKARVERSLAEIQAI